MGAPPHRVVRVRISGSVQRVGFRMWMEREALVRGLCGWVRNRSNGDLEALLAGEPDAVESLVQACSTGPARARVSRVEVTEGAATDLNLRGASMNFDILPTV